MLEPGSEQVAVLKHDPLSLHGTSFDPSPGRITHPLTEGQELEFVHAESDGLDQFLNIAKWIGTWTEDEDDRSECSG